MPHNRRQSETACAESDGSPIRHEATYSVGRDVSQSSTSICVLDPDGKTVVEGQTKTNPIEIGRYLQKRQEGPLTLGLDRILALPGAEKERRAAGRRVEARGRLAFHVKLGRAARRERDG